MAQPNPVPLESPESRDHLLTMNKSDQDLLEKAQDRYESEKNKRWRPDGPSQYINLKDSPAKTEDDYRETATETKDQIEQHVRVLIVGAGFGGLILAVRMIQSGLVRETEILFVDCAGGFGGTWWWNQYPGLSCDVESYTYMPLLEETNYMPSQKYVSGTELREHAERIANQWKLSDRALFATKVTGLTWNDQNGQWTTKVTQSGQLPRDIKSNYVYLATGLLDTPKVPKLDGMQRYKGKIFHTSRWDYHYTGGTPSNPSMDRLQDKRIGFVGTGASAVQAIPHLAQWAAKLIVFQRTPSAVDSRNNCTTDPVWWKENMQSAEPGWQKSRMENFNAFVSNESPPPEENLVDDQWTKAPSFSALIGGPKALESGYMTRMHEVDLIRQETLRRRVTETVTDPATARDLQPWYPGWCKRPCFSDDFLAAFNRPNVVLVDTNGKGINTVTDKGILFEGTEFDLDAIILGTGYAPSGSAAHSGIPITGRGGRTLEQKWLSSMASFHGVCTNGFPNLFFTGPPQAAATVNQVYVLDQLARHVVYIISEAEKLNTESHDGIGRLTIEPSTEAEEEWTLKILSRAGAFGGLLACTPSYFNREGLRLSEDQSFLAARFSIWGEGIRSFVEEIEGWRNKGQLVGMEISSR